MRCDRKPLGCAQVSGSANPQLGHQVRLRVEILCFYLPGVDPGQLLLPAAASRTEAELAVAGSDPSQDCVWRFRGNERVFPANTDVNTE